MIEEALAAIADGLVIGLPTDTVYGIGADPHDPAAVGRLFDLKGRSETKPIGVLVGSVEQASEIAQLDAGVIDLALRHWPGALTLVVRPKVETAPGVGDDRNGTIGVRVPDHPLALRLLSAGPLAVTSANVSGGSEARSDREARALFGDRVTVYLPGECPGGEASTVVDVTGGAPVVLRKGPISL